MDPIMLEEIKELLTIYGGGIKSIQRGCQNIGVQGAMTNPSPVTIPIANVDATSAILIANIEGQGRSSANINAPVGCQLTENSIVISFSTSGFFGFVSWQVIEFY